MLLLLKLLPQNSETNSATETQSGIRYFKRYFRGTVFKIRTMMPNNYLIGVIEPFYPDGADTPLKVSV